MAEVTHYDVREIDNHSSISDESIIRHIAVCGVVIFGVAALIAIVANTLV